MNQDVHGQTRHPAAVFCWRYFHMMTSSNGNIFHVNGPLWGKSISHWWILLRVASNAEFWSFLGCVPKQTVEQTFGTPMIWDGIALIITSLWWIAFSWQNVFVLWLKFQIFKGSNWKIAGTGSGLGLVPNRRHVFTCPWVNDGLVWWLSSLTYTHQQLQWFKQTLYN